MLVNLSVLELFSSAPFENLGNVRDLFFKITLVRAVGFIDIEASVQDFVQITRLFVHDFMFSGLR